MKKNQRYWRILVAAIFVLALLATLFHFAFANYPSPPTEVWFNFDFDKQKWQNVQAVQILGCYGTKCEYPVLLHQYGDCTDNECLGGVGYFDSEGYKLKCAPYSCYSTVYPDHGGNSFEVLVQISDKVYLSEPIKALPIKPSETQTWKINLTNEKLLVNADSSKQPLVQLENPWIAVVFLFLLSIFLELLTAYMYFRVMLFDKPTIKELIWIVLFVNFVTLPVVWCFFPAFGYFHYNQEIIYGSQVAFMSLLFGFLLIKTSKSVTEMQKMTIAFIVAAVPISIFLFFITYVEPITIAQGLPAYIIIALEEIFAVVVEALLMIKLSNHVIPKKHAWILALVMNSASFLVGQGVHLVFR